MATLRAWREQEGLSRREVADRLGTDTTSVFRWELPRGHPDKRIPTQGFMGGIHSLTRGAVAPNDFYDLPPIGQLELPIEAAGEPGLFDVAETDGQHELQAAA